MIKLFDEKFDIQNLKSIYGLVNSREDKYSYGLTHFSVSTVFIRSHGQYLIRQLLQFKVKLLSLI